MCTRMVYIIYCIYKVSTIIAVTMGKKLYFIYAIAFVMGLAIFSIFDADVVTYLYPEALDFNGQVIWITGASSGIGASLARELTKKGARVILSARRVKELEDVASSCIGPYKPFVLPLDVTNMEAQVYALATIMDKYQRIDSVVLNAGNLN